MGIKENLKQQLQTLALQQNSLTQQLKVVEQNMEKAQFTLQTLEAVEKESAKAEAEQTETAE